MSSLFGSALGRRRASSYAVAAAGSYRLQPEALGLLCALAVISDLSYSGLQVLFVEYGRTLHFGLTSSGWVATVEGAGFTGGTLLIALVSNRIRLGRKRVAGAFICLATAQILSAMAVGPWGLAACRCLSGIASGLLYGTGIATIAASDNPERGLAVYFGAIFVSGLTALALIPSLIRSVGLTGFYVAYGGFLILCTILVRWYPAAVRDRPGPYAIGRGSAGQGLRLALLAALFINFVFNGGLWILAAHFGLELKGANPKSLGALLAGTMVFGLLGTAAATLLARRWNPLAVIIGGNVGLISAVLIMSSWHSVAGLVVAMALLNVSVTTLAPAVLSALACQTSKGAQWGNLATQAGYSVGPIAISAIATRSGPAGVVAACVVGFLASAGLAWVGLRPYREVAKDNN